MTHQARSRQVGISEYFAHFEGVADCPLRRTKFADVLEWTLHWRAGHEGEEMASSLRSLRLKKFPRLGKFLPRGALTSMSESHLMVTWPEAHNHVGSTCSVRLLRGLGCHSGFISIIC